MLIAELQMLGEVPLEMVFMVNVVVPAFANVGEVKESVPAVVTLMLEVFVAAAVFAEPVLV